MPPPAATVGTNVTASEENKGCENEVFVLKSKTTA